MIQISYPLTSLSPLYPGTPLVKITQVKDIRIGDSSSTSLISFSSHAGTHLDLPSHVCPQRGTIPIQFDSLRNGGLCICIDIPKKRNDAIMPVDISIESPCFQDIQVILIRTGSWKVRKTDPTFYSYHHPWLHPDCVTVIRENFPSLKIIGVDFISLTNPDYKAAGREAHRRLLCEDPAILILEDLDLSSEELLSGEFLLTIIPYIYDCPDGMPVFCFVENVG